MLACTAARAFASSLLEQRSNGGGDGPIPLSTEVLSDHQHARLHAGAVAWKFCCRFDRFVSFPPSKKKQIIISAQIS